MFNLPAFLVLSRLLRSKTKEVPGFVVWRKVFDILPEKPRVVTSVLFTRATKHGLELPDDILNDGKPVLFGGGEFYQIGKNMKVNLICDMG